MTSSHHLIGAKSLAVALLSSFCVAALPQIAHAINRCGPNVFTTENLGLVTQNPYNACPYGDPLVSPRCTTLTFSAPGPFSMLHGFNYEPQCPGEIYNVTFNGTYGEPGYVRPKYIVLGVYYAPPGSQGSVTYGTGFMTGGSIDLSQSFGTTTTVSVALTAGASVGVFKAGTGVSASESWTQEVDNSSQIAVDQTYSNQVTWPGPQASAGPNVDHAYDVIAVWLDPEVSAIVTGSNTVASKGFYLDPRDPLSQVTDAVPDVIDLTVGQLEGLQPIPPQIQAAMNRTWDPGLGALTSADLQDILKSDPFAYNPGFDPNTDNSGRYVPVSGASGYTQSFLYEPTPAGAQPACDTYQATYDTSQSHTTGGSDTHTVGYTIDSNLSASWFASGSLDVKFGQSFTYTNKWSSTFQTKSTKTASFHICQPPSDYTGPYVMQVWEDNVYGTYMFYQY